MNSIITNIRSGGRPGHSRESRHHNIDAAGDPALRARARQLWQNFPAEGRDHASLARRLLEPRYEYRVYLEEALTTWLDSDEFAAG